MENKEDNQEKKPYSFMKEIIKKKPLDKRALLLKIAGVAAAAVVAGIIAAFVFVKMVPVAEQVLGTSEEPPKVNIPADEEPTATATPEATPTPTVVDTPQATPEPVPAIGLTEYKQLYKDMLAVAEKPKHALVTVIEL